MKAKNLTLTLLLAFSSLVPFSTITIASQTGNGPIIDDLVIKIFPTYNDEVGAFEADQIDFMDSPLNATLIQKYSAAPWNATISLDPLSEMTMFEIDLNNNDTLPSYPSWSSPTSYQAFRHALAHLTDKARYVNEILDGYGAVLNTPVMPWIIKWYNPQADAHSYNQTEAAMILDAGGFSDANGDGIRDYPSDNVKANENLDSLLFFAPSEDLTRLSVALRLATEMLTMGVPVNLTSANWSAIFNNVIVDKDYHMYVGKQDMYHSDICEDAASTSFGNLYSSNFYGAYGSNYVHFNNTEFDNYIQALGQAPDETSAKTAAKEAQRILAEQAGIIPLFATVGYKAHKNQWIDTVNEDGNGIDNWWTFISTHLQNQPTGGNLTYGILGNPNGLSPLLTFSAAEQSIIDLVYDSLLRVRDMNIISSRIANSWVIDTWQNPDTGSTATKLIFTLNSNINFHDGTQLTSDDVKFTIEYIKTHAIGNHYPKVANVHHISAPDASTVLVYENTMNRFALNWIGSIPIIPRHKWQSITDPMAPTPESTLTGSGPFRLVSYEPSNQVLLTANRNYGVHDVAVTMVSPAQAFVYQPNLLEINVTVQNQGNFAETINIAVFANSTVIGSGTIQNLAGGNNATLTINWNTTDFPRASYTIRAYTEPVPGELDQSNNEFIDGIVQLRIVGDTNGDKTVNANDLSNIEKAYGSSPGDPDMDPACDFNSNSKVDGSDLYNLGHSYGKTDP